MTEAMFIRNKLKPYLKSLGIRCIKIHGGPFSEVGVSDLLGCLEGQFLAMEVKVGRNEPSPAQFVFLKDMYTHGAKVGVIYDRDYKEDINTLLTQGYVNCIPFKEV